MSDGGMRKLRVVRCLAAGAGLFVIGACSGPESEESRASVSPLDLLNHAIYSQYDFNKEKNVVNVGTQPLYLPTGLISEAMTRDKILEAALSEIGLEVKFYPFLKGDDVNFFFRRGDLDGGFVGDMPALTIAATHDVAITNLVQMGFTSIVAKRPMLVKDLRGRRIGYAFGSNAHFALLRTLSSAGLSEADVRLVSLDVDRMAEALHAGEIEAFSAFEPTVSLTLSRYSDTTAIHRSLSTGYFYLSRAFEKRHTEAAAQVVAASVRALRYGQRDEACLLRISAWSIGAGEALIGRKLEVRERQVANLAKQDIMRLHYASHMPKAELGRDGSLHDEFEFLKALGKIPRSAPWEKARDSFDKRVISEILAHPRKYRINEHDYLMEEATDEH